MDAVRGWAIAWYRKEDWTRWRAVCPDFAADHDRWLERATAGFAQTRSSGYFPEKVMLDPDEFLKWSSSNGGKVDGKARSQYAVFILASREGPGH